MSPLAPWSCEPHYNGLGRTVRQVQDLRVGGTGAGVLDTSNPRNPDGQVTLHYMFDKASRLVGIGDDNGNRTSFAYDHLSRRKSQTNADGESYVFTFDKDDNVRTVTDPNGSVITKTYDALNRMVESTVVRGLGVAGTTRETWSYDGASRVVRATDDNGGAASTQTVELAYDSLGRLLEERQNGKAISSRYAGDGKRTQVTYPGGRTITRTFDGLDRIVSLIDQAGPTTLATSDWIGPGLRELRRVNGNGTALTFLDDAQAADAGYDAVQRITRLRVLGRGTGAPGAPQFGAPIVDREYAYNRASQRTLERRHDDRGLTDRYTYDSVYRVVSSSFDQDGLGGALLRDLRSVAYRYDGVGNRREVTKQSATAGATQETYTVNAVNEYVTAAQVARSHDDNGNLTDDGARLYAYDYKNRLVGVVRKADSRPIALYSYLPDGRRSRKQVWNPDTGALVKDVRLLSDGPQEVEEQDWTTGTTLTTYVWSPVYVDELVSFTNSAGTFYAHQDARCDVVAITNAAGAVVERGRFDDFGRVEVRDGAGAVVAASPSGCDYGFQGRKLDPETGLVFFRARYYSPETGRFVQRDPVWDAGNVGGQYTFCGNGPVSGRDPSGEQGGAALLEEGVETLARQVARQQATQGPARRLAGNVLPVDVVPFDVELAKTEAEVREYERQTEDNQRQADHWREINEIRDAKSKPKPKTATKPTDQTVTDPTPDPTPKPEPEPQAKPCPDKKDRDRNPYRVAVVGGGRVVRKDFPNYHPPAPTAETINPEPKTLPDIVAPAQLIPRPAGHYNVYIGERLPREALDQAMWNEAARITRTGGPIIVATGHGQGVRTDAEVLNSMKQAGIRNVSVEHPKGPENVTFFVGVAP